MLKISSNRRFLQHSDGTPFFWLADTAWQLFHYLSKDEADFYLQTRAAQGFTVIQAVVLAEYDGFGPNTEGECALNSLDPTDINEAYFAHVDWVIARANELNLVVGLVPTWGDKWNCKWGAGPEIFTPENARSYGKIVGARWREANLVWLLGGDRPIESEVHLEISRAFAHGVAEGEGGAHLRTWHPCGGHSSADWLHDEPWLDFNMRQTGHLRDHDSGALVLSDYHRLPTKPTIDGEPGYEDHPSAFKAENGFLGAWDTRKFLWWDLCAGAFGHTYGCHDVWQFWEPKRTSNNNARTPWQEAVFLPGALQMQHARRLMESRPFFSRVPAPEMLAKSYEGAELCTATRDSEGRYAIAYSASGCPLELDLNLLSGKALRATWFDPREGSWSKSETFTRDSSRIFSTPTRGTECDWVLVIDDVAQNFPLV